MTQPLVSVIVPTYNGEKRIARTLESLIAQDYENLEIIVVDDVSADNTVITARRVLESSGRKYAVIERMENGRQSASRNTGLKAASGEYVIFFDHDDTADRNFVSALCAEAEAKNADLVFCGLRHFREKDNSCTEESSNLGTISPEKYLEAWTAGHIRFWSVWNFIFRKRFLDEHSLRFPERCRLGEDTEFTLKAIACASKMSGISDVLYTYIHHSEQSSIVYEGLFPHILLARLRTARFVMRHVKSKRVRRYMLSWYIPDAAVKQLTIYAENGERERYCRMSRTLKHRKIRRVLLSSCRYIFRRPELFMKSLMLIYAPDVYYALRKGRAK
ncbi:MAG: glycosyltransferase family 2 protein [Synergistaceae bacterium]|nr:glycosyltransferase family 2 protein [Synergistaceae bacterium]